jgi:hypothetical protein
MAASDHTVRLRPATYDALEREARRRGRDTDVLADQLVQAELTARMSGEPDPALAGLANRPDIDRIAVARGARSELEQRGV